MVLQFLRFPKLVDPAGISISFRESILDPSTCIGSSKCTLIRIHFRSFKVLSNT